MMMMKMSVSLVEETGTPGGNSNLRQVTDKCSHIRPVSGPSTEPGPQRCEVRADASKPIYYHGAVYRGRGGGYTVFISIFGSSRLPLVSLPTIPPVGRRSPLLRTRGYVILRGGRDGSVGRALDCKPMCCPIESSRG